jgi:hypothetical protein
VFAILVAGLVVWCVDTAWCPTISRAIRQLPEQGEIRQSRLHWQDPAPRLLAAGHFLAFIADPNHTGRIRAPSHVQVEFGRDRVRFISVLGYADVPYPSGQSAVAFNRKELQPWWGAWRPPLLWITFALVCLALMLTWWVVALVLAGPAWFMAFFANRRLDARGSWKLAGAALLPGALLMAVSILLYGLGVLDHVQLLAAAAVHLLIDFAYVLGSPIRCPRLGVATRGKNPFAADRGADRGPEAK